LLSPLNASWRFATVVLGALATAASLIAVNSAAEIALLTTTPDA